MRIAATPYGRRAVFAASLCFVIVPERAFARGRGIETLPGVLAGGKPLEVVAGELLVKFSSTATSAQRAAALAAIGGFVNQELPSGWQAVTIPPGVSVAEGLRRLADRPGLESYQANHIYRPIRVPNDALVPMQPSLSQVNAFAAWDFETGASTRVTIVVIDAGIEGTHPDLGAKIVNSGGVQSQNCETGACAGVASPAPACNHATQVAGIAAASAGNGAGIAGISWGAQLLSLRVFPPAACGNGAGACPSGCVTDDAALSAAIAYSTTVYANNNAAVNKMVINMSIGGAGGCPGSCPGVNCLALTQAGINRAVQLNIPVVIAAGNDGGAVNAPANCAGSAGGSGIIPVGATDGNNQIAAFSSRGPELAANGLVAPGVAVETTDINASYTSGATGTSFAAPHVAGLAALILAAKPAFTAAQVQSTLRGGADNIGVSSLSGLGADAGGQPLGNLSGAGRMDAFRSLRLAVRGTLADFEGDQKAIAFPNPFRVSEHGAVSLTIPQSLQGANAKIKVYTVSGQLVRELAGLSWDGKNKDGRPVASGTYLFLVSSSNGSTTGRVALLR